LIRVHTIRICVYKRAKDLLIVPTSYSKVARISIQFHLLLPHLQQLQLFQQKPQVNLCNPDKPLIPNPFSVFDNASVILAVICGLVLLLLVFFGAVLVYYAKKRQREQKQTQRDSQATIPEATLPSYQSFYSPTTPASLPSMAVEYGSQQIPYPTLVRPYSPSSIPSEPQYFLDTNANTYYIVSAQDCPVSR
jgi:hypothetical protein